MGITESHRVRRELCEAASRRLRRSTEKRNITARKAGTGIIRAMTTITTNAEVCSVCKEPVRGGFETFSYLRLGEPVIEVTGTPDRNFNVCDLCNATICYRCSESPETGYCNECYRMVCAAQSVDRSTESHEETDFTPNMEEPKIIYRHDEDWQNLADEKSKAVSKLLMQRELDVADFQGRIETLTDKLHEVVEEFADYVRNIDAAIMELMGALRLPGGQPSDDHPGQTN